MTNQISIIKESEVLGQQFKIYGTAENPLFLAKEVARVIEHSDVSMMLRNVDDNEKATNIVCTLGGEQKCWFLTEDGLYEVLMQSRKPIAKQFKQQVKEILKTIRKTGGVVSNADLMVETYFGLMDEQHKALVKGLLVNIESLQPRAKYCDNVMKLCQFL